MAAAQVSPASSARINSPTATRSLTPVVKSGIHTISEPASHALSTLFLHPIHVSTSATLGNIPQGGNLTTKAVKTSGVTSGGVSVPTTTFVQTSKSTAAIVTTVPTITDHTDLTKSNAGTIAGLVVASILVLVVVLGGAFCFFRRQRRKRRRAVDKNADPYNEIGRSTVYVDPLWEQHNYHLAEIGANAISSTIPLPPQDIDSGAKRHITALTPAPQHKNQEDDGDPFRDPDPVEVHQTQEAGNAFNRLQQLTREVEAELQNLANQAQSGQLSATEQARLDEIRHTTGLTIMYDSRLGRFSTSSTSSAPPPPYRSNHDPFSQEYLPH